MMKQKNNRNGRRKYNILFWDTEGTMFKFKHSKINSGKICKLSGYFFGQQTDKRGVTQINNLLFI